MALPLLAGAFGGALGGAVGSWLGGGSSKKEIEQHAPYEYYNPQIQAEYHAPYEYYAPVYAPQLDYTYNPQVMISSPSGSQSSEIISKKEATTTQQPEFSRPVSMTSAPTESRSEGMDMTKLALIIVAGVVGVVVLSKVL
jgi:hypothetical protein